MRDSREVHYLRLERYPTSFFFFFFFQFSVFFIYIEKENGNDSGKVNIDHNFFEYLHVLLLFLVSNKLHKLYEQFG